MVLCCTFGIGVVKGSGGTDCVPAGRGSGEWKRGKGSPKPGLCSVPWSWCMSLVLVVQHSPSPCPISVSGVLAVLVGSCPSCSDGSGSGVSLPRLCSGRCADIQGSVVAYPVSAPEGQW